MTFFLLILVMMAGASSVFAYHFRQNCDGVSYRNTRYCMVDGIGEHDIGYYKIELITDNSGSGCKPGYYALERRNGGAAIRVYQECNGYFGIKPKVKGYPYKGSCGQDNFSGFKIINGYSAGACRFPWMAFVKLDWKSGYRQSCGGSIVNDRWILTAAHCIIRQHGDGVRPPASTMFVRTGSQDKVANYIQREVDWIVTHPSYDKKSLAYDVGLLRLRKPIKWDGCHAPVCLNTDRNIDTSLTCRISGWGTMSTSDSRRPNDLKWAYDYLLTRRKCDEVYRSYSTSNTICGRATSSGNRGFCSSDSGGPLVCKSKQNGRYYQHGIVSVYLGHKPCRMEGLYSSVAAFYNWITGYTNR